MSNEIMTEEELEEMLLQSSYGAENASLARVVNYLMAEAGEIFSKGKDDDAHLIRREANVIKEWQLETAKKLDKMIQKRFK